MGFVNFVNSYPSSTCFLQRSSISALKLISFFPQVDKCSKVGHSSHSNPKAQGCDKEIQGKGNPRLLWTLS